MLAEEEEPAPLRILKSPLTAQPWEVRSVGADSFLWQERDLKVTTAESLKIVTRRQPTEAELKAMLFGWRVVKHVKSNAIVYAAPIGRWASAPAR